MSTLLVALSLALLSNIPPVSSGYCPRAKSVDSLDLKGFQGRWYEAGMTSRLFLETSVGYKCSFLDLTPEKGSPTVLDVTRSANRSLQSYPYAKPADKKVDIFTDINTQIVSACR